MLFSLGPHAGGYKMMVGTHNIIDVTVECQMHVEVPLSSLGMADVGTCIYY